MIALPRLQCEGTSPPSHDSFPEQEGAETPEYEPAAFNDLTDDEVAAAARAWWLDDLCERRDAEHDEGFFSFVEQ